MTSAQLDILIDSITTNGANKAVKVRDILKAIKNEICLIGEVKHIDCTQQFITDNFDSTGLGKNLLIGYAMCNGFNGTKDRRRKTSVGYDSTPYVSGNNYSQIGNTFGEEKHQLTIPEMPSHSHNGAVGIIAGGTLGPGDSLIIPQQTSNTGGDQAHNNMQPSIVSLMIQRIA